MISYFKLKYNFPKTNKKCQASKNSKETLVFDTPVPETQVNNLPNSAQTTEEAHRSDNQITNLFSTS